MVHSPDNVNCESDDTPRPIMKPLVADVAEGPTLRDIGGSTNR